ncbi:MAG: type II toxin-antitoxin system VapC family toxin, partial [Candidatus Aminicenantes bacterium]|nr:type II toxin-antitoxin system VapC family toxin [Candidatus Aminicenantes bacterium]
DSSAYSRFVSGEREVLAVLSRAKTVYFSVFVLGELLAGLESGTHEAVNKKVLSAFLAKSTVVFLVAGEETADYYGRIWAGLKKAGRLIPTNDVWIAAQAMETGSVLVTYDAHFAAVPGLRLWDGLSGTRR